MDRNAALDRLKEFSEPFDILIIGGGATGLGAAVDAASRGYKVALVEQHDFAKGTSSRSTKLIHGGVRYLKQGNISLVRESLRERTRILNNASHLAAAQAFAVPSYGYWDSFFYSAGLKVYGILSGNHELGKTQQLSRQRIVDLLPTLNQDGLKGGVRYFDGQFDDARLAVNLAQTAHSLGATVANYVQVKDLIRESGRTIGATVCDLESQIEFPVKAKCVINATGVFADTLRHLDDPQSGNMLSASRGVHIVLDHDFLPGNTALMIPKTDDGRVLFAIPWHGKLVVGTTDTADPMPSLEPRASESEIEFLLDHTERFLNRRPKPSDVRSVFAGLRPLVSATPNKNSAAAKNTAAISRDHVVTISDSGLVTITGGKWTTYRVMGSDAIDAAVRVADLKFAASHTEDLKLFGAPRTVSPHPSHDVRLRVYGTAAEIIAGFERDTPSLGQPLGSPIDITAAQVQYSIRQEMARTVEDILARRTRWLLLDAKSASAVAGKVAKIIADELGRDSEWISQQIADFQKLASEYQI